MSPRLASALVLAGVFALGGVTGGGLVRFAGGRGEAAAEEGGRPILRQRAFIEALDREVHLSRKQRHAVRSIIEGHEGEVREIRRAIRPQTQSLRARTFEEVRGVMHREQLDDYQRFVERQEARARAWEDGR